MSRVSGSAGKCFIVKSVKKSCLLVCVLFAVLGNVYVFAFDETTHDDSEWVLVISDSILRENLCNVSGWYNKPFNPCRDSNRYWNLSSGELTGEAFPMSIIGIGTLDSIYVPTGCKFQLYSNTSKPDNPNDLLPYGPLMSGPKYVTIDYWQGLSPSGFEPDTFFVQGGQGDLENYSIIVYIYGDLLTKADNVDVDECRSPGDEITYTICWDNTSGVTFEDANIIDYLPDGVDYPAGFETVNLNDPFNPIPADPNYDPNDHSYIWYIGDVLPNDSNCVTLDVVVNEKATPGGTLRNVADIWAGEIFVARTTEDTPVCCDWGSVDPNIIYVDDTATGYNNGTNWQNAHTDLQDALYRADYSECAQSMDYKIWVAGGTYSPGGYEDDTFTIPYGVEVYGSFAGNEDANTPDIQALLDARDFAANKTTLDGNAGSERNKTLVTMGDETRIDGFIIKEADDYGVYGNGVDFIIENCSVIDNLRRGIKAEDGDISVKWSKIKDNKWNGIEHIGQGYAIDIENSVISNNDEHGLYTRFSTPNVKNCVVANNGMVQENFYGINILFPDDVPVLHNNTIAYNVNAGIFFFNNDPNNPNYPEVENCILWYNNGTGGQIIGHDPNYLKYNCIFDANDINGTDYTPDANYNFTGNPGFAYNDPNQYDDPDISFNPHLAYDSPCIDMGSPYLTYTDQNDIDAEDRVVGSYADVGADEVYSCDDDLTADDIYNQNDWNADGVVNLWEHNLFSAAWLTHDPCDPALYDPNSDYNDPCNVDYVSQDDKDRWNEKCNLITTGDSEFAIDIDDLTEFIENSYWLWTACWKESRMENISASPMQMMGGESMMMMPMSMEFGVTEQTVTPAVSSAESLQNVIDFFDILIEQQMPDIEAFYEMKTVFEDMLLEIENE